MSMAGHYSNSTEPEFWRLSLGIFGTDQIEDY